MIDSIKDLEKLLKLCRKQGVTDITLGAVSFKLGDMPETTTKRSDITNDESDITNPYHNFPTGNLTPTQLIFYSAGGKPEDDPELQEPNQ